jgi:hypothetical protein
MTDLNWAVQKAVFDALAAAAVSAPVKSFVTADDAFPYVQLGDDIVTDLGTKDCRCESHELTIITMVSGKSRKPMSDLQEEIRAALHDQPIGFEGAKLSHPKQTSAGGGQVDIDLFMGTQTFQIIAQDG